MIQMRPPGPGIPHQRVSGCSDRRPIFRKRSFSEDRPARPPEPRRAFKGRPCVATEEVIRAARDLLPDPGRSITSIAKLLGVSPGTLYNHIPDLRELRAGTLPRQLEAPAK